MRVLLMGLFAFSMVGCATTGAADATAKAAKVGCCAQAKAEGKACEKCAAKKAAVGDKAKKECCVQAAASGQPCTACATKKATMDCCAQAAAEGKPCAKCATKKAPSEEGTL